MQDSNPGSLEPNLPQIECPLTNRLSNRLYEDAVKILNIQLFVYVGLCISKQILVNQDQEQKQLVCM